MHMYYSTVQGRMMFVIYILRLSAYFVYVHMFMAVPTVFNFKSSTVKFDYSQITKITILHVSHVYLENTRNIFWFCSINVTLCNWPDMEQFAVNRRTNIHVQYVNNVI